jgi:hypothetical protein
MPTASPCRLTHVVYATLFIVGLALVSMPQFAAAQTLPPRAPIVEPVPSTTPVTQEEEEQARPTPVVPGRITGTVIDQRTGAPVVGVRVRIGTTELLSDANGNYDHHGLAPGRYALALHLDAGQGAAAQGELALDVGAGQTLVQHLFFTSPVPLVAAPPSAESAPAPATLPATGTRGTPSSSLLLVGALLLGAGLVARRMARS